MDNEKRNSEKMEHLNKNLKNLDTANVIENKDNISIQVQNSQELKLLKGTESIEKKEMKDKSNSEEKISKEFDFEDIENIEELHEGYRMKEREARRRFFIKLGIFFFLVFHTSFIIYLPLYALFKLIFKYSWQEIIAVALDPIAIHAYILTFKLALIAAFLNSTFGYIITWVLIRFDFKGKDCLDIVVDLPLGVPTSIAGITLTAVFGNEGWLGPILKIVNFQIIYTKYGVLLAMIFASFPFVIRGIEPILEKFDYGLEEAAWTFGANSYETAKRLIFPTLAPALLTGFILNFSRALGEFGSVVMVSSNSPFDDLVTSVLIHQAIEQYDYFKAAVIGAVVLIFALIIIFIINKIRAYYTRHKIR